MKKERIEARVDPAWLAAVDEWRRRQPKIPSRGRAIRELVEVGLEAKQAGESPLAMFLRCEGDVDQMLVERGGVDPAS